MARFYSNTSKNMTLTAAVDTTATAFNVSDATGLPVSFPYNLAVDADTSSVEIVEVTAAAGNVLTVVRGRQDTSAKPHTIGAPIYHAWTALDGQELQDHLAATSNVHGVGAASAVVGTNTTQTLQNKTISGLNNTITNISGSSVSGALTNATIPVANVTGDWPIDTRSTGNLPIDTRTTGNLPIDTRSTGSIPVDTRTTGNLPGSRLASPITAAMTFNSTINSGAITSTGAVKGTDFTISGAPDRSVKAELDQVNNPRRLYLSHTWPAPHNSSSTITGQTVVRNVGAFTFSSITGIARVPVNGDYEIRVRANWNSPSGANAGACDVIVSVGGTSYSLYRMISRGADGSKAGAGNWDGPITTAQDVFFNTFQNANGGATLDLIFYVSIKYVGPSA